MKKLALFIAAGMVFLGAKLYAGETVAAPTGEVSNPINADYGGVEIATNAFNSAVSTVPSAVGVMGVSYFDFFKSTGIANGGNAGNTGSRSRWRVYGVLFSTGNCGNNDFVDIFTSSVGAQGNGIRNIARFYNVANSTAGFAYAGGTCSGLSVSRWPIRAYGNLFYQSSSNGYNHTDLLYWKEPD